MKLRPILAAALLTLGAAPAAALGFGTPVSLGSQVANPAATSMVLTTVAAAPAGQHILVLVDTHVGASTTSVTDSAGNTYAAFGSAYNSGGIKQFYRSTNAIGLASGGTITFTSSGSSRMNMLACALPNSTGSSFDTEGTVVAGTFTTPSTTPPAVTSPTLASSVEKLLIGWVELNTGALDSEITDNGGWTEIDNGANAPVWHLHWAFKKVTAATTAGQIYAPTLSTSRAWVTNILSIKGA